MINSKFPVGMNNAIEKILFTCMSDTFHLHVQ